MSAHGIDVAALSAALATVAGGGTPPIPDPPRPPSPPPPPAPGGDELLSLSGTMTLHGQTYPVGVVLSLLASSPNPTAVNFLKLLADIAALMSAVVSKNWAAAAAAIATILADLGLTMSAAQRSQIMAALATADAQYGPTQALKAAAAAVRDNTNGN
jgi:hypothetical protein